MIRNYTEHASNERTFLAWVRTAIAIVAFGLAISRFGNPQGEVWSEIGMLGSGAAVIVLAFIRMRHVRKRIDARETLNDDTEPSDALLVLLIIALFVLIGAFLLHVR